MMVQTISNRKGHLSQEERIEMYVGLRDGTKKHDIRKRIGRHHTVITREVSDKGRGKVVYDRIHAHKMAEERGTKANHQHIILWRDHKQRTLLTRF